MEVLAAVRGTQGLVEPQEMEPQIKDITVAVAVETKVAVVAEREV